MPVAQKIAVQTSPSCYNRQNPSPAQSFPKLCGDLDSISISNDDLLDPARGPVFIPSVVCAEESDLQQVLLESNKIDIGNNIRVADF
jgi:hypothetical protein